MVPHLHQHAGEKRGVAGLLLGRTERQGRRTLAVVRPWRREEDRVMIVKHSRTAKQEGD